MHIFSSYNVPKPSGIQVMYGKQNPTHDWNRYVNSPWQVQLSCRSS